MTNQNFTQEKESDGRFAVSTFFPSDTRKGRKESRKAFNRFANIDKAKANRRAELEALYGEDADWMA